MNFENFPKNIHATKFVSTFRQYKMSRNNCETFKNFRIWTLLCYNETVKNMWERLMFIITMRLSILPSI